VDRERGSPGVDPCDMSRGGGVWRYRADKLNQRFSADRQFATGIRNAMGLAFSNDGKLWATQHGRDQLHYLWPATFPEPAYEGANPGEELMQVNEGDDFGWPYCYYDVDLKTLVLAPEYGGDGRKTAQCSGKTQPLMAFPGHWAPNDIVFYTGNQFPSQYKGGAFIAFHGSWNRAPLPQAGFRVVFAPFRFNRPVGTYTTFADGFNPNPGPGRAPQGTRRPTGLAQAPDGSLFLTDDSGGTVWRITYRGTPR